MEQLAAQTIDVKLPNVGGREGPTANIRTGRNFYVRFDLKVFEHIAYMMADYVQNNPDAENGGDVADGFESAEDKQQSDNGNDCVSDHTSSEDYDTPPPADPPPAAPMPATPVVDPSPVVPLTPLQAAFMRGAAKP